MAEEVEDELDALHRVLEVVFDDPGLSRLRRERPRHPAVATWDLIDSLRTGPGIDYEDELPGLRRLAFLTLDRMTWFSTSGGTSPGISSITDEAWRQIRRRVVDETQYFDVLAELYTWGYLSKAHTVDLTQVEACADLLVRGVTETAAEVKRIRFGTAPSRIKR